MAKVANPAIVIGLGGTGQWVLTHLKKNLLDTYGGVPDTVELLAFDTTSEQTEASVTAEKDAEQSGEERAQVGNVSLGEGEFVYLGGNIRRICEEIRDADRHEHIGSWLQAKQYLAAFDDDAYEISKGAGQRRPFGRMAVFYDLATGSPKITSKLTQAINDVMTANQRQQPIEFYIVTSVAGGTGSGMFIDMAHIARKMAGEADVSFAIRGFIVLPNTFDPVIKVQNIEPNAFAAMRELDRFMLVFDRDYPIYYSERPREPLSLYHSIYKSKLFDSCHLVDAVRPNLTLRNIPPTQGVFPAVAECMTAFLDPETGNTFFQHYKNIGNEIAKAQTETGKAIYSSVGTYTYILPVEDMIDRNTYKAAIELLRDHLLKIEQDPDDKKLRVSSTGNVETSTPPREEATSFLQAEKSRMGVQNLHFSQQIAQLLESGRMKEQDFIADVADAGIEMLNWVLPPEQDQVISDVSNSIQAIFETSFVAEVPNSKVYGDGTPAAAGRIKTKIQHMREKMLGREDASGNRTQGELQKGLLEFQNRNVTRFRRLLTEKLEDTLNGTTDDPMRGKVGKLPYARDFAGWLVQAFDEFIAFMRAVVKERADRGELSLAREDALTTKQMMDDTRNLTGILDRLKGTAVNSQNQYIGAENYLLELERQEILYQSVLSTVEALKAVASEARAQCNRWVNVLALGGPIEGDEREREIGVYTKLRNEQGELQRRREEQAQIKVYKYLSGPGSAHRSEDDYKYEDELYSRLIGEKWSNILRRFSWDFEQIGGGLYLHFNYGDEELAIERDRQKLATEINTRFLLEKLRPYFYDVRNETIADRMEYLFTAQGAAKNLLDNSGAMISYAANEQKRSEKRNFVCVNRGIQVRYFDSLTTALQESAHNDKDNQVIGLTNKHRCIVLSTVDLLTGQDTAPYRSAKSAYKEYRGNRKMLHNFPAEVHASEFEQRLSEPPLYEAVRFLDPTMVALLEDQDMVRRFVLSLVYGLVREEEAEGESGQNHYVLRLDRGNRRDPTAFIRLTRPATKPQLLDAMKTFVYPKVTPESDKREIWDVTPDSAIRVEPSRIDEALEIREQSVLSGREVIVEDFKDTLKSIDDLLTNEGQHVLPSAFRLFLADNERTLRRCTEIPQTEEEKQNDPIMQSLHRFLDDNDDCYERAYRAEIQEEFMSVINRYRGGQNMESISKRDLARRFERYIDEQPDQRDRRKGLIERLKNSGDQLDQDLGAIMHLILWDEIDRLEGLSDY